MKRGNLVLKLGPGESVLIGDDIEVTVVERRGRGGMRVAFRAPRHLPIHRKEIYERIQRERLPVAASAVGEQWDEDDDTDLGREGLQ